MVQGRIWARHYQSEPVTPFVIDEEELTVPLAPKPVAPPSMKITPVAAAMCKLVGLARARATTPAQRIAVAHAKLMAAPVGSPESLQAWEDILDALGTKDEPIMETPKTNLVAPALEILVPTLKELKRQLKAAPPTSLGMGVLRTMIEFVGLAVDAGKEYRGTRE